jgi:hypothetical protein
MSVHWSPRSEAAKVADHRNYRTWLESKRYQELWLAKFRSESIRRAEIIR